MKKRQNCDYCNRLAVKVGKCARCYWYTWFWMKRGPKAAYEHRGNLIRRQVILDDITPANVQPIRKRA